MMLSYLFDFFVVSTFIRYLVGYWDYSGYNKPPMFGDFEAQRHWMEITINLNIGDWYRHINQSKLNDLRYWGLDYPPLTAYVSYLFGYIAKYVYPDLVQLSSSKGHESITGKLFMRLSVIICDCIVFLPSIFLLVVMTATSLSSLNSQKTSKTETKKDIGILENSSLYTFLTTLILASVPSLLLIDHGHFQYNGVCIGLTLLAVVCISRDMDVIGSILFCLALNFKQMALYYSPVFFFALLYKCNQKSNILLKSFHLLKIGMSVIITFAILWSPFCMYHHPTETCYSSLLHPLKRIFPFSRGIFEDKVANLWYSFSVIFDYRDYVSSPQDLIPYSLGLTVLLLIPIAVSLLRKPSDSMQLCLALSNSALVFFLASFQVHEKSLLLSLVPAAVVLLPVDPVVCVWYQLLGSFTIFPLLVRDGLRIPYFAVNFLFVALVALRHILFSDHASYHRLYFDMNTIKLMSSKWNSLLSQCRYIFLIFSTSGMIALHMLEAIVKPPSRYPDLYPALISLFGAANLVVVYIIGVFYQYIRSASMCETSADVVISNEIVNSDVNGSIQQDKGTSNKESGRHKMSTSTTSITTTACPTPVPSLRTRRRSLSTNKKSIVEESAILTPKRVSKKKVLS